jgi:arylsulfatase A-like enzyme
MQPARVVALAAAIAAAVATGCGGGGDSDEEKSGPRPPAARNAPNIVVVMTDDQTAESVRSMPKVRTDLLNEGMTFDENFVTTPECCPSRATFFTGQYSHNHGVFSSGDGYASLTDKENILPAWLQSAGYETAHVGKYINGYGNPGEGGDPEEVPEGWNVWRAPVDHTDHRMFGFTLNRDGSLREYGEDPSDYQTDVFADEAVSFIEKAPADRPFFLSVAPTAPHSEGGLSDQEAALRNPTPAPRHVGDLEDTPQPRPPSFDRPVADAPAEIERKAGQRSESLEPDELEPVLLGRSESLLAVDDLVGRVVDALDRRGELAETFVFFTSDNGFMLGEHGLSGKAVPYEEAVRVPLIVRGPGIPAGSRARGLAANIDLAPTIAEMAQAEPGRDLDGITLVPALSGRRPPEREIGLEYLSGREAFTGVRTDGWMFARFDTGGSLLYDVENDPFQLQNLAQDARYAETKRRLRRAADRLAECAGTDCR